MITFDESISPWVKYRGGRMPFILFGDETGKFSFENSYIIELNNENLFKQNYILGFAFSDFDNDGDIDIMINSTRAESAENGGNLNDSSYYNNHIVYGIENKENTTYIDSSNLFFDKHYLFEPAIFPDFYEGKFIDKDGDGDFDYVPATPPNWGAFDYISNFYYNKSNKSFTQRLED